MRILLTRPLEQSEKLAPQLRKNGLDVVICPMMTLHKYDGDSLPGTKFQAIILTSANSLRFSDLSGYKKDTHIFTVGDKTAKEAQLIGFKNVISADGNLEKLSDTIKKTLKPQNGALLYIRGKHIAGPLTADLRFADFEVFEHIVYEMKAVPALNKNIAQMILNGDIDFIPFYSQRSALIFKELIERANLENSLKMITALAISPNVSHGVEELPWKDMLISDQPTQSDLYKLIDIDL